MNWLEKIQTKPHHKKIQLIWIISIVAVILLIIVWIITAQYNKKGATDKTLFETLDHGVNDIKNNFDNPLPHN